MNRRFAAEAFRAPFAPFRSTRRYLGYRLLAMRAALSARRGQLHYLFLT